MQDSSLNLRTFFIREGLDIFSRMLKAWVVKHAQLETVIHVASLRLPKSEIVPQNDSWVSGSWVWSMLHDCFDGISEKLTGIDVICTICEIGSVGLSLANVSCTTSLANLEQVTEIAKIILLVQFQIVIGIQKLSEVIVVLGMKINPFHHMSFSFGQLNATQ